MRGALRTSGSARRQPPEAEEAVLVRGNEAIRAGSYLSLTSRAVTSECYVYTVTNDFAPYSSYMISVALDRATGFIERTEREDGAYVAEMRVGRCMPAGKAAKSRCRYVTKRERPR